MIRMQNHLKRVLVFALSFLVFYLMFHFWDEIKSAIGTWLSL